MPAVRAGRWSWLHAFGWYILLQRVCRLVTPAALNVNLAHRVREGWEGDFPAYWQYWLFTTLTAAACFWSIGWLLARLFPPRRIDSGRSYDECGADPKAAP